MYKLFMAAVFSLAATVWAQNDITTLQDRLAADYLTDSYSSAAGYLSSQQADGSWSDINYADIARTGWTPVAHLQRVRQMAISYKKTGGASMLAGVEKGLQYWYDRKPTSNNWWQVDIGQQLQMGPILIMVEEDVSPALVDTGCTYLNDPQKTGQNLVWFATQTVWRGCLKESETDITRGLNAIKSEVKVTTGDGIQVEGSFYQHNEQLYNGGYGKGFVNDVSFWIHMTRGLSFAFNDARQAIFDGLVLDGTQWMVRRGRIDPSCAGREITRPGNGAASVFLDALDNIAGMGVTRSGEYARMAAHIRGTDNGVLNGNKHFWRTDYQVHRRSGYHMSVKMCSKRTYGTEVINQENTQGRYLPFGCTYILVDGDEYADIFPVWDWARIPGVTAPQTGVKVTMPGSYVTGTTDFVGGASNGVYGAAVLDFSYDNTVAKKSWFFFNEGCMALGVGITGTGGLPVYTSVDQCLKNGDVTVSTAGAGTIADSGQQTLTDPAWVHHGRVGYVFPGSADVVLKNASQRGRWYDINTSKSKDYLSKDVVSMWFDHGTDPAGASYAYAVLPAMNAAAVQSFAAGNPFIVVSNTDSVQAVRHADDNVTGIIFHTAGQLALGNGTTVRTDKPCAMVVDESGDTAGVTVSNPLNTAITVTVDLICDSTDDVQHIFILPSGAYAGQSITLGAAADTSVTVPVGEVIASSDDGNVPENTVDGDFDTRWSANGIGQWIRYDLGTDKTVTGIQLATYNGDARKSYFSVSVSSNGTDWTTVIPDTFTSGTSLALEPFACSPVSARYVKITGGGNSSSTWNSYTEVRIDTMGTTGMESGYMGRIPFRVAPAPLTGRFAVAVPARLAAGAEVTVQDAAGRLLDRQALHGGIAEFDAADYARGMVVIGIHTGSKTTYCRVPVVR